MVYNRIPPEDAGGSEHVYCEEHGCWKFKDAYGQFVCVVCLVADRLFGDEFEWVDDYSVRCPDCDKIFDGMITECPNCGRKRK